MSTNLQKYLFLLLVLSLSACRLVRHVPQDQLLLRDEVSVKGNKSLDLETSIRTTPNKRVIWPKFYLMLYNTGLTLEQDSSLIKKWFVKAPRREAFLDQSTDWLINRIGEAPAIIQPEMLKRDSLNIVNAYSSNGFFDTKVTYEVEKVDNYFERRRGKITFFIEEGKAFYVRNIWLKSELPGIVDEFKQTREESYIQGEKRFSYQTLALERTRFANHLRAKGYFAFSPNSIHFQVDTLLDSTRFPIPPGATLVEHVEITDTFQQKWLDIIVDVRDEPTKYRIKDVIVVLKQQDSPDEGNDEKKDVDKISLRGSDLSTLDREAFQLSQRKLKDDEDILFKVSPELIRQVNYNFIAERIYFKRDKLFSRRDAILTQEELQSLTMFQYVLLNYEVDEEQGEITVRIEGKFAPKFEFKTGIEAYTNDISTSFTLPIFGASLSLRNKNAFRRSELMELSLGGNIGRYPVNINDENVFWQIQGRGNVNFPRFILPFPKTWLPERYRSFSGLKPSTVTSLSVLRDRREEFNRLSLTGNVHYRWFNKPRSQQEQTQVSPLNIEYIDYDLDPAFQQVVDDLPAAIRRGYQSRFNSWLSANYTISNYGSTASRPTFLSKINYEGGGNIPRLIELLSPNDDDKSDSRLILRPGDTLGLAFGQYVKLWWEGKTQVPIGENLQLVLRAVAGGALPFGRTQLVPIERRFFTGGPSSMRGWQSNTLGPGTFPLSELLDDEDQDVSSLLAIGGEYLLEMNAELRFHVWSYLDMAVFTDVGNVWINPQREGSSTDPNNFNDPRAFLSGENLYPGWDAGIGFRLDFSFLILRIDIAQQIFDPGRLGTEGIGTGWVIQRFPSDIGGNSSQIHVGIGYPF